MAGVVQPTRLFQGECRNTAIALAVLVLAACSVSQPVERYPIEVPEPVVAEPAPIEPQPEPVVTRPVVPVVVAPKVTEQPQVAVVLTSRQPAFENVATELDAHLDNYTIFDLSDKSMPPVAVFRKIEDSNANAVVAIGLRAAISAISMATVPVVFAQVFNYAEHGLVTDNSRGVSALPPLDLQIAAWKKIDPSLISIGAIVGEGHEDLIEEARLAAQRYGVELHIRTVSSDRETLYVFNRLVGNIDGFWLFPDNRVLSSPVLKEMLNYASRHRVQIAVFNDSLLEMGAAVSSTTVEANIAETISNVVDDLVAGRIDDLPSVTSLSDINIVTNDEVLQRIVQGDGEATLANGE